MTARRVLNRAYRNLLRNINQHLSLRVIFRFLDKQPVCFLVNLGGVWNFGYSKFSKLTTNSSAKT